MRILLTYGSKRGGTEGLAEMIAAELRALGVDVDLFEASRAPSPASGFDGVIVGGALYANRWHHRARVRQHERELTRVPVWFFSSGPLDDSAAKADIPPTNMVLTRMERVGAQGHMTFGGRLEASDPSPLAKDYHGDYRGPTHARAWAARVASELPTARPKPIVEQPARGLGRLVSHAIVGWAACAAIMGALLAAAPLGVALAVHAALAPIVFVFVARRYFAPRGACSPLPTAAAFTVVTALMDLVVVAWLVTGSLAMFSSVVGTWLPLALIFLATLATGELMSTMPWPKLEKREPAHAKS